jgi:hypothetical protein
MLSNAELMLLDKLELEYNTPIKEPTCANLDKLWMVAVIEAGKVG